MFVFANFILAVANILGLILDVYMWIIIISALISWVNPDPYNPIVRFLHAVTEPVLRPIRRFIEIRIGIGIDISPMIVILIILFIKYFLISSLIEMAFRMKE